MTTVGVLHCGPATAGIGAIGSFLRGMFANHLRCVVELFGNDIAVVAGLVDLRDPVVADVDRLRVDVRDHVRRIRWHVGQRIVGGDNAGAGTGAFLLAAGDGDDAHDQQAGYEFAHGACPQGM